MGYIFYCIISIISLVSNGIYWNWFNNYIICYCIWIKYVEKSIFLFLLRIFVLLLGIVLKIFFSLFECFEIDSWIDFCLLMVKVILLVVLNCYVG